MCRSGLVPYLCKERYHFSEALISLVAGIIFSPYITNLIRPLEYALGSQQHLATITIYFTRLVLGVQLVLAGVQLLSKYLVKGWKSLALLLGPGNEKVSRLLPYFGGCSLSLCSGPSYPYSRGQQIGIFYPALAAL